MGNTTKKRVVTHHSTTTIGVIPVTSCGIDLFDVAKSNKTWRGVTCKSCLAVKAKADRLKAARKKIRTTRKTVATS